MIIHIQPAFFNFYFIYLLPTLDLATTYIEVNTCGIYVI